MWHCAVCHDRRSVLVNSFALGCLVSGPSITTTHIPSLHLSLGCSLAHHRPLNHLLGLFFTHSSRELAALARTTTAVTRVSAGEHTARPVQADDDFW